MLFLHFISKESKLWEVEQPDHKKNKENKKKKPKPKPPPPTVTTTTKPDCQHLSWNTLGEKMVVFLTQENE